MKPLPLLILGCLGLFSIALLCFSHQAHQAPSPPLTSNQKDNNTTTVDTRTNTIVQQRIENAINTLTNDSSPDNQTKGVWPVASDIVTFPAHNNISVKQMPWPNNSNSPNVPVWTGNHNNKGFTMPFWGNSMPMPWNNFPMPPWGNNGLMPWGNQGYMPYGYPPATPYSTMPSLPTAIPATPFETPTPSSYPQ